MNMPKLRFKADDGADFTEWESMLLGDLVYIQRGGSPRPIAKYLTTGYGINWIKIGDAPEFGHYITATKDKIIPAGKAKSREVHPGDLILSNSMSYGYPYILKIDGCIHDGWLLLRERNRPFDKVFLCEYLGSKSVQCQYERLAAGSAAKNLNIDLVSNVIIDLPSLQEQRKIADLLLAVDDIIDKQQAEIKAWEQYKKGVAQKLFDQEVRFKADDGSDFPDWESKILGELGSFYGGLSGKSKEDFVDGTCPYITYKNVYLNTFATPISDDKVKITQQERQNKVKQFDVLFTQSSETFEEVGLSSVYLYDDEPYLNSFCKGFRFNNLEQIYPKFIGYLLRSDKVRHDIILMGQGISRINLRTQYLSKLNFKLPSLAEQRKIAECLGAIDDVIALSKAELEKWRELKKGLLQQLFV